MPSTCRSFARAYLSLKGVALTCFRGHDNCEHGSIFEDEASVYLNSGTIQAHELQAEQLVRSFPVSHNAEFQPRSQRIPILVPSDQSSRRVGCG